MRSIDCTSNNAAEIQQAMKQAASNLSDCEGYWREGRAFGGLLINLADEILPKLASLNLPMHFSCSPGKMGGASLDVSLGSGKDYKISSLFFDTFTRECSMNLDPHIREEYRDAVRRAESLLEILK